jgi:protease IV
MIGVDMVTMEATGSPLKGLANNAFRDWTDEDRAVLRKLLDTAYERFVYVVDQGRTMLDEDAVRAAASGAVYTAQEALDLKLVDAIGFREDAIAEAAQRIGLPADAQPHVTMLAPRQGFGLMSLLSGQHAAPASSAAPSTDVAALATRLAADPDRWAALLDELTSARLVYRAGWKP